ncbi:MAG TPA: universal stress protein [Acidimicrobiales bacterium]|nr:universal stress protein [Acidimicrobiales bacterium]
MELIVGIDGSENSVAALRWAASYAALTGATIHAVTTWEFPVFADTSGMVAMPGPDFFADGAQSTLDGAIAQAELPADIDVAREVVEGHPARVLLDRSANAALLVVGRRGHSGILGAFTGSVANACANHAQVPVVIVPVVIVPARRN